MFEYRISSHIEYRTFSNPWDIRSIEPSNLIKYRISSNSPDIRSIEPSNIEPSNLIEYRISSNPPDIRSIEPSNIEHRTFLNQQIFDRSNHRISNIELPIRIFIEWFSNPNLDPGSRNKQDEQTFLKCPKWPKATWNRLWFILLLVPRQVWDAYILIFRKLFILFSPGTWELEVTRALGLTRALGS